VQVALRSERGVRTVPVVVGEIVRLGFRHSVYGSTVEEEFLVEEGGLRLVRLRYGEARLVEYYGHEQARHDAGWWIVDADPSLHASITVRVSVDGAMRLATRSTAIDLSECVDAGGSVRVSVVPARVA
jgi:hypothetical protein